MIPKRKTWLYCLSPDEGKSFYYVENDVVKVQSFQAFVDQNRSFFLLHNPAKWQQLEIDWGTSDELLMNRAYALQLEFVYEGAKIIRSRQYFGAGSEEPMWLIIAKWNRNSDEYGLEVKIALDMSTTEDTARGGVSINSIEGGISKYLAANRSTPYEIACDDSNPAIKQLLLDGQNLQDSLIWNGYGAQLDSFIDNTLTFDGIDYTNYVFPVVFTTEEGESTGIIEGQTVQPDMIGGNDSGTDADAAAQAYAVANDGNATLDTENPIGSMEIKGELDYKTISLGTEAAANPPDFPLPFPLNQDGLEPNIYLFTNLRTERIPLYVGNNNYVPVNSIGKIPFSATLDLQADERIYFEVVIRIFVNHDHLPLATNSIQVLESSFIKASFKSRKSASQSYVLSLYDYYKQLVLKLTDGKYTGESEYLKGRTDLVITCGDSLRNTDRTVVPNYLIAGSFDDLKQSCPSDLASGSRVGLQIRGNVLYLEPYSVLYSNANPIYDLGEVSGLKITANGELLCNEIDTGYPDQDYETNGGKYEFNSEQVWKDAIISRSKTLNLRSIYRADSRGIEDIRARFTGLDTTDNAGDKTPFLISVTTQAVTQSSTMSVTTPLNLTGQQWIVFDTLTQAFNSYFITDANKYIYTFTANYQQANVYLFISIDNAGNNVQVFLFKNGQSIATYTGQDGSINLQVPNDVLHLNDNYEVRVIPSNPAVQDYTVTTATLYFEFLVKPLILNRPAYTSITGVLDNTVYNVPLRPKNQIYGAGVEISAMLAQILSTQITLTSSAKNVSLSTVLNGITETENEPINASDLAAPLWYAYNFTFTTQVPYTFAQLFAMSTAGYFAFTYNGIQFFALPIGQMKSTPVNNAAQEWTLRVSALNLFSDLYSVSYNENVSLIFNNNLITKNIYCPLHLVKYDYQLNAKYRHKDTYDDWTYLQYESWIYSGSQNDYKQPWQLSDTIIVPIKTAGNVGTISMLVYNSKGELYQTYLFAAQSTPYVKLPEILQIVSIPLASYDEGYYLFVVNAGGTNIWISDWCDIKERHIDSYGKPNTFLFNYGNSENELNISWLAYPQLQLRVQAEFEQWEADSEFTGYEDDQADFYAQNGLPLQKRNMFMSLVPDWMALKVNSILLKDKVYIEGTTEDCHYTRREGAQMETTKYPGNPYIRADIEVIPARNPINQTEEDIPVDDVSGWHATIDAQVYGEDDGSTEILIGNG